MEEAKEKRKGKETGQKRKEREKNAPTHKAAEASTRKDKASMRCYARSVQALDIWTVKENGQRFCVVSFCLFFVLRKTTTKILHCPFRFRDFL